MKFRFYFFLAVFTAMILGCSSSKPKATASQIQHLDRLVAEKSMRFKGDWAIPLATNSLNQLSNAGLIPPGSNSSRINLIGNFNFLEIKGDSVIAQLPYYGERQIAGGYGQQNVGIEFKGLAKKFVVEKDERSMGYTINFTVSEDSEVYDIAMRIFPNLKTNININSTQRLTIGYQGVTAMGDD